MVIRLLGMYRDPHSAEYFCANGNGGGLHRVPRARLRNGPDLRVGLALDRAQTKLERIKRRLKDVQEEAAAEVQLLTVAETKLAAAIVAALLSGQR
jgi:hypothetical protein